MTAPRPFSTRRRVPVDTPATDPLRHVPRGPLPKASTEPALHQKHDRRPVFQPVPWAALGIDPCPRTNPRAVDLSGSVGPGLNNARAT